jgi:hypothetical protein
MRSTEVPECLVSLQVLVAYMMLIMWDLRPFTHLLATDYGCKAAAIILAYLVLRSRAAQLRIQVGRGA